MRNRYRPRFWRLRTIWLRPQAWRWASREESPPLSFVGTDTGQPKCRLRKSSGLRTKIYFVKMESARTDRRRTLWSSSHHSKLRASTLRRATTRRGISSPLPAIAVHWIAKLLFTWVCKLRYLSCSQPLLRFAHAAKEPWFHSRKKFSFP